VKAAYRRKAMDCHPDRIAVTGMTLDAATEAFKRIGAAFAVLARELERFMATDQKSAFAHRALGYVIWMRELFSCLHNDRREVERTCFLLFP
jgi:hypothetical protein